jgi:hypothetical protein
MYRCRQDKDLTWSCALQGEREVVLVSGLSSELVAAYFLAVFWAMTVSGATKQVGIAELVKKLTEGGPKQ